MVQITKRDGRVVPFDPAKITNAILKAMHETELGEDSYLANSIADKIAAIPDQLSVEEIQDIVEESLMESSRKDVAKQYIIYRNERNAIRMRKSALMRKVVARLDAADIENQNANVDEFSFGGRMGAAASEVTKEYALNHLLSPTTRFNHVNNLVYVHDLDHYALGDHNCMSIPFDDLLARGFSTRQTDVRPAQSVNTAMQLVAVIFQLQSLQQFGGVSATHLDWTMVPYVRKSFAKYFKDGMKYLDGADEEAIKSFFSSIEIQDTSIEDPRYVNAGKTYSYASDMLWREVYQAVEGLYHNLNTLQSRSGNQLPFTSVNYGTCTLPEGRMVIKALLSVSISGIGALHRTSIFPCGIFQSAAGINRKPGDPNYDLFRLALASTAQRLYPNYANVDWSGNAGYDIGDPKTYFSTMGCRTANGLDINGFGQQKDGRGNICPTTIILPTLAMMAKEKATKNIMDDYDEDDRVEIFISMLDEKIHEAKDSLIDRYNYICSQSPNSARFMYENNVIAGFDGITIESAMKHGTLAIGQLGLAETLQILIGCDHTTDDGMKLAKRIESLYRTRCDEFKKTYHLNFGVYYSPCENLSFTAMKKFQEVYGIIPNVSDKKYFTNSMHVPVWHKMSAFRKIDIESQLTGYSNAGCITYVELESSVKNNIDALETLVLYAMEKDIPYFAVNVPNDMCVRCGYTDDIDEYCPMCGCSDIRRLRRVTGLSDGR